MEEISTGVVTMKYFRVNEHIPDLAPTEIKVNYWVHFFSSDPYVRIDLNTVNGDETVDSVLTKTKKKVSK